MDLQRERDGPVARDQRQRLYRGDLLRAAGRRLWRHDGRKPGRYDYLDDVDPCGRYDYVYNVDPCGRYDHVHNVDPCGRWDYLHNVDRCRLAPQAESHAILPPGVAAGHGRLR
jgi:hypothetical protein